MKHWGFNLFCLLVAVMSGVGMFMLKYKVIEKEEELARLHRQIAFDKREIHMLKGDWASLNDPERLRALVVEQTNFKQVAAEQIVAVERVPMRMQKDEEETVKKEK